MRVPFHKQRLDFTCGPACLIMAMGAHDPEAPTSFADEVAIWREATVAAVPATSRYGLALAARRRGFRARVIANHEGLAFRKRIEAAMPWFYEDGALDQLWDETVRQFRASGLTEEHRELTIDDVDAALDAGDVPIVLTSTVHFGDDEDIPHWVVIGERDGQDYHVMNPLDEAPPEVTVTRDLLARVLGFGGNSEMVVIGPRDA